MQKKIILAAAACLVVLIGLSIRVSGASLGVVVVPGKNIGYKITSTPEENGAIGIINIATNATIGTIEVGGIPTAIAVSRNGARAYVTNAVDSKVQIIDTENNTVIGTIDDPSKEIFSPNNIVIDPNGTTATVTNGGNNNMLVIINLLTNSVMGSIPKD